MQTGWGSQEQGNWKGWITRPWAPDNIDLHRGQQRDGPASRIPRTRTPEDSGHVECRTQLDKKATLRLG